MAYGHAERNLAAIRLLEAETRELLKCAADLDAEHPHWLHHAAGPASRRLRAARAEQPDDGQAVIP